VTPLPLGLVLDFAPMGKQMSLLFLSTSESRLVPNLPLGTLTEKILGSAFNNGIERAAATFAILLATICQAPKK
jgi:hypothetical protein